jgi:hypothetical protein
MNKSVRGFFEGVIAALAVLLGIACVLAIGISIAGITGAVVAVIVAFVLVMGMVGAVSS